MRLHEDLPSTFSAEELARVGEQLRGVTPGLVDRHDDARRFRPEDLIVHFDTDTRNDFARTFGYLALDRPTELAFHDGEAMHGNSDHPPALQRIVNAAAAHTSRALHDGLADFDGNWGSYPPGPADTAAGRGAGFLIYLGESAGLALTDDAEAQQAYNEYLKKLISGGAGLVPVADLVPGGKLVDGTVGLAYSTATDAILDRVIDTGQVARATADAANLNDGVQLLLDDIITGAVVANDTWPEGQDPVTYASTWEGLNPDDSYVVNGSMRPIDEILADEEWSTNFFVHYLQDEKLGGREALEAFYSKIDEGMAAGAKAQDHWDMRDEEE